MAARKSTATKKRTRRKSPTRETGRLSLSRIEQEMPASVRDLARQVRRDLSKLEKRIDKASRDGRRRLTRVLRDPSRELGRLEAQGQKRWRALTEQTRRDALKAVRRLEKALAAPRKKTTRKRPARRAT